MSLHLILLKRKRKKNCEQNKTKQNKTKQNKTKQNKTKQNKTKHSLLCRYGLTSAAALLLTFGGASAVKANEQSNIGALQSQLQDLRENLPKVGDNIPDYNVLRKHEFYQHLQKFEDQLNLYLKVLDQNLSQL
ncbi:TPA: hypothetical protein ACHDDA_000512, partial [Streptococcus pyogenes]